ncbi:hypothetical protein B0H16DRAFT_1550863 [Mycena metata]|uniref:Uncharacterized protein n=1 Tax=Mycena metata TaxID=1033252 RepID=A0AAD7IT61_9AGAR|nr:hypothetical protein B0H16DRAFT_1550863 [Mycena metata]
MPSHRAQSSSSSNQANSPVEYSLPSLRADVSTPPWLNGRSRLLAAADATPSPQAYYVLPPREIISVVPQAKLLHVVPPEEDPVLRDHVRRPKGSKPKGRPEKIVVVPAARPIAIPTAHTPSVPAPMSAVFSGHGEADEENGSAPGTPYTPEPTDPGLLTGLPRALGMQAFPIRADRPWRHGG